MDNNKAQERANKLKELLVRLEREEDKEAIQKEFNETFGTVSTKEIAMAEQLLMQEGTKMQEIGELCNLHTNMFGESIEQIHGAVEFGHPLKLIDGENIGLENIINNKIKPVLQQEDKGALLPLLHSLKKISSHYGKKDNLLFPYLEKAGLTGPSTVMWENESKNRKELSRIIKLVEAQATISEETQADIEKLLEDLLGMIKLEREILFPMVQEHVNDKDWILIAEEALAEGYVFLDGEEGASLSDANTWLMEKRGVISELATPGQIKLPTGSFTKKQLRAVMNAMDLDITVIDADYKVIYFNEMSPRYFPRTKTILGRNVYLCHPPQAIDTVRNIIEDLKAKRRTSASFYFPRAEYNLLINYVGLYDGDEYIGCLERVQDIKPMEKYFEGKAKVVEGRKAEKEFEKVDDGKSITLDTKLNTLLKQYPQAFETLLGMSPAYKNLNNPVMLKTMGVVASLRMIADRGGFKGEEFLAQLKEKLNIK